MTDDAKNGRTHEPSLREITAELDGLRDLMQARFAAADAIANERDRRYGSQFEESKEAVRAALAASKELTDGSFKSSEKAITKAEDAQREYNTRSNEFRGQLEDQAARLMPKDEANTRFQFMDAKLDEMKKRYDAELASLREYRSERGGEREQQNKGQAQSQWAIGVAVAFIGLLLAAGCGALVTFLLRMASK